MRIYVDIETTGLDPKTQSITRISGIKAKGYEVVDIYDQLVNPRRPVPDHILRMTGLNQQILDLSPSLDDVRDDLLKFFGNHFLVSWAGFELKWFRHYRLSQHCTDAIPAFKRAVASKGIKMENFKLDTVCRALHIPLRHHDSLSDALAVYHICLISRLQFRRTP